VLPSGFLALSVAGVGDRSWRCGCGIGLITRDRTKEVIRGENELGDSEIDRRDLLCRRGSASCKTL
jgi:hypothetical protein